MVTRAKAATAANDVKGHKACTQGSTLNPIEHMRAYSSVYANQRPGTGHARSMLDSYQAWSPARRSTWEWTQVDLGTLRRVKGTVIQGRYRVRQWVTKYKVLVSADGKTWMTPAGGGVFNGARDSSTKVWNAFPSPVLARWVRFYVMSWVGYPSARVGVFECGSSDTSAKACAAGDTLNPPESSRRYSTVYGNNRLGTGHARSMLDSVQAWSAKHRRLGEWMQIDVGSVKKIKGTVIQGRYRHHSQWVTRIEVSVSADGRVWREAPGTGMFSGSVDMDSKVWNDFQAPIDARYVRITVWGFNNWPSMRAGVLLCGPASKSDDLPAAVEIDVPEGCFRTGYRWLPINMRGQGHTITNNEGECQTRCEATPGCAHFTYYQARKVCHLQDVKAKLYTDTNGIAGPRTCPEATFPPGFMYMNGKSWDLRGTRYTLELSAQDCQARCTITKNCAYFSYLEHGACHLQDKAAKRTAPPAFPGWMKPLKVWSGERDNTVPKVCDKGALINPPEHQRSYSSILKGGKQGSYFGRSRLDSPTVWQPSKSETGDWMQIDLGKPTQIYGVVTQGRNGKTTGKDNARWVSEYQIMYSDDGAAFDLMEDVFAGNTDADTKVEGKFPYSITARYVRFMPNWWHQSIGMRAAIYACKEGAGEEEKVVEVDETNRQKAEARREKVFSNAKVAEATRRTKEKKQLGTAKGQESTREKNELQRVKDEYKRRLDSQKDLTVMKSVANSLEGVAAAINRARARRSRAEKTWLGKAKDVEARDLAADRKADGLEKKRGEGEKVRGEGVRARQRNLLGETAQFNAAEAFTNAGEQSRKRAEAVLDGRERRAIARAKDVESKSAAEEAGNAKGELARIQAEAKGIAMVKGTEAQFDKDEIAAGKAEAARAKLDEARDQKEQTSITEAKALEKSLAGTAGIAGKEEGGRARAESQRDQANKKLIAGAEAARQSLHKQEELAEQREKVRAKTFAKHIAYLKKMEKEAKAWDGEGETTLNDRRKFELERRKRELQRQAAEKDRIDAELEREKTNMDWRSTDFRSLVENGGEADAAHQG